MSFKKTGAEQREKHAADVKSQEVEHEMDASSRLGE